MFYACWAILLALLAGYWISPLLPVSAGWENGVIENTQVAVCLFGLVCAIHYARRDRSLPDGWFWLIIIPFWAAFAARELSWGATLFAPLEFSELTGPGFSSRSLPYRPLITPVLALVLLGCLYLAWRHRLDRFLAQLVQVRQFPLAEAALFVLCMMTSAVAEGHMGLLHLSSLDHLHAQVYEEWAECLGYATLWLAQLRIHRALPSMAAAARAR